MSRITPPYQAELEVCRMRVEDTISRITLCETVPELRGHCIMLAERILELLKAVGKLAR